MIRFFNFIPQTIKKEIITDDISFRSLAEYGHVGRSDIFLPWEKTNKAYIIRAYLKEKYGKQARYNN